MKKNKKSKVILFSLGILSSPIFLISSCSVNKEKKNNNFLIPPINENDKKIDDNSKTEIIEKPKKDDLFLDKKDDFNKNDLEKNDLLDKTPVIEIPKSPTLTLPEKNIPNEYQNDENSNQKLESKKISSGFLNIEKEKWFINDQKLPNKNELEKFKNDYSIFNKENRKPTWLVDRFFDISSLKNNKSNLPLPQKDNLEFTDEEIMDMFDYIAIKGITFPMYAGEIKIDAKRLSKLYINWTIKNWKNYPWFSFENGNMKFMVKNKKTQEIKKSFSFSKEELSEDWELYSISAPDFLDKLIINNKYKASFVQFVKNALMTISEDMKERDKVFSIYNYVIDYFKYNNKFWDQDEAILYKGGVCANYATAYSYLLNLIGIETLPMLTGLNNNAETLHEVVWIYLDLYNDGNKKWYLSDATFSDFNRSRNGENGGFYSYRNYGYNYYNFLRPVGINQFETENTIQFPYNQYWHLPLPEEISNEAFYGKDNVPLFFEILMERQFYNNKNKYLLSNFIYVNNKYYVLRKDILNNRIDFVHGNFIQDIRNEAQKIIRYIDEDSNFSSISENNFNKIKRTSERTKDFNPLLIRRSNLVFFILDNVENAKKQLLIYDLDSKKERVLDLDTVIDSNQLKDSVVKNFYFLDDELIFDIYSFEKKQTFKSVVKQSKIINSFSKEELFANLISFKVELNSYKIGDLYFEINEIYKKWFYNSLLEIEKKL